MTTNSTSAAAFSAGRVRVILADGGLGESDMGATHESSSCKRGWSGKREAVCPSGPMPSTAASSRGKLPRTAINSVW